MHVDLISKWEVIMAILTISLLSIYRDRKTNKVSLYAEQSTSEIYYSMNVTFIIEGVSSFSS